MSTRMGQTAGSAQSEITRVIQDRCRVAFIHLLALLFHTAYGTERADVTETG